VKSIGREEMAAKVRHILGLSGGKDSAALAVYMRDKVPEMEYFFCDTHKELDETYDFIHRLEARLGIHVQRLEAEKGFDHFLELYNGFLPSAQQRWCTIMMKLKPLEKFVGDDEAISYVAIRADEKRIGYVSTKPNIKPEFPFQKDGIVLADIKRILDESGIGIPEYYKWRSRSGCYFCFFQRKIEWVRLQENHPDLFEKAKAYETAHSDGRLYTWNDGETLEQILARKETIIADYEARQKKLRENKPNKTLLEVLQMETDNPSDDGEKPCFMCHL